MIVANGSREKGVTLVELMVAMAIGLLIVLAVSLIYLNMYKTQRALERKSNSLEGGEFLINLLGKEIANAGFYPSSTYSVAGMTTQQGMYDSYPPLQSVVRKTTDWQDKGNNWPPVAYMTGVYGCEGGEFNIANATCPSPDAKKSDSIVINYFTNDAMGDAGSRKDCTGSLVDRDPSNSGRIKALKDPNQPPKFPLFVSNRYTLRDLRNYVDYSDVATKSFSCSGNGMNRFGDISSYQPILHGIKEMHFLYAVLTAANEVSPDKFYTATEVANMSVLNILGQEYTGWQRVVSVKVCVLSQSQGGGVRLEDKTGSERKYLDCDDSLVNQPSGQWVNRFVQVFGVRNGLKQSY